MTRSLTPEQVGDNEDAARAMFTLLGGVSGYFNLPKDSRLADFAAILHADPDNDLSGLRLIASRMQYGIDFSGPQSPDAAQRFVEPNIARWWLTHTRRARQVGDTLELGPKPDHLALAALAIASSDTGRDFYEAYFDATDSAAPLSRDIVTDIAVGMIDGYFGSPELEAQLYGDGSPHS